MRIDWNWWNASVFCIIPILSVITVFFLKRKLLWIAPLISTVLSIAISVMMTSTSLLTYKEHRAMFFGIVIPIQLVIVIILTVGAYLIAYIVKRIKNRNKIPREY